MPLVSTTQRVTAWGLAAVIAACIPSAARGDDGSNTAGRPPHIVLLLADDLGWADLSCYGNAFNETPHLDRLAAEGVRFTDAYAACPVCSPTRASIQSGQYQARFGLTDFIPGHWRPFERLVVPENAPALPLEITTVAEALRAGGYATAHHGKWHLGLMDTHGPTHQGFDDSSDLGRYFPDDERADVPVRSDVLVDRAIRFLEEHHAESPVFVQVSFHSVHIPLEGRPERVARYASKPPVPGYPSNPVYAAMLEDLDGSVGRMVEALDRLGIAEQTLLVFVSDNGGLYRRYDGGGEVVTRNGPLRGEKGTLYEGGIRVPMIVRWPGVTPAGVTLDEPVTTVDLYPTFLDAAVLDAVPGQPLDGISLLPRLDGSADRLDREAIYWHYPHYHHADPAGAIRSGRFKLVEHFGDGSVELYDLEDDISEHVNLADARPELAVELQNALAAWRRSVGAALPTLNPDHDPARADHWYNRRTGEPLDRAEMDRRYCPASR